MIIIIIIIIIIMITIINPHSVSVVAQINQDCIRNQTEVEKYVTGTNSSPEHASEPQNWENPNLGTLNPPSYKSISKVKRIK